MLNQLVIVGRITHIPTEKDKEICVAVTRDYKNDAGIYETDFIKCNVPKDIATQVTNYCRVGDIVGIKGRAESEGDKMVLIAKKFTFLAPSRRVENGVDTSEEI